MARRDEIEPGARKGGSFEDRLTQPDANKAGGRKDSGGSGSNGGSGKDGKKR